MIRVTTNSGAGALASGVARDDRRALAMTRVTLVAGSLLLLLVPARSRADLPPPAIQTACDRSTAGAACEHPSGQPAQCVAAKCSKLDYSQGTPPRSIEHDCLQCQPGAAATPDPAPAPAPTSAPTPTPAPEQKTPPEVESRCAVDPASGLLAMLVGVWAAARRRRR